VFFAQYENLLTNFTLAWLCVLSVIFLQLSFNISFLDISLLDVILIV